MKKKVIFLTLLLSLCVANGIAAEKVEIDGIYYQFSENGAMVCESPSGYSGDVYIPDYVPYDGQQHVVFTINAYAFQKCKNVTSVRLPNHLKSISVQAFDGCTGLTSIAIPASLEFVMSNAFKDCYYIKEVHITDLAAWCKVNFSYSSANPLHFAQHLYLNGEEVIDLVIPESVTSLGSYVFSNAQSLQSVTFPEGFTSIGNGAFWNCLFTSIKLPKSLKNIGGYALGNCSKLTSIDIPENVTSIGEHGLAGCKGLTSVVIPNNVYQLGTGVFYECTNLTSVVLPDYVETINGTLFAYCNKLTTVVLPKRVGSITNSFLYLCTSLKNLICPMYEPAYVNFNSKTLPTNCALYIPAGREEVYARCKWTSDNFKGGVYTDFLLADNVTAYRNGVIYFPLYLYNGKEMQGIACDLDLPEGISVKSYSLSERKGSDHVLSVTEVDGHTHVQVSSASGAVFSGINGPVVKLQLGVDKNMSDVTKAIGVSNIKMTVATSEVITSPDFHVSLAFSSIESGDADGNGEITITDATAVANNILGNDSETFVRGAGDINGDGKVTITDAVGIVNKVQE